MNTMNVLFGEIMMSSIKYLLILIFCSIAGLAAAQDVVVCPEGGTMTTTIKQPPPSAIAPQFSAGNNSDLCTIGASASVQTQILGFSAGGTYTEENCKRLKNAKVLYDMGMKVAAVSLMCGNPKIFDAMMQAGTPCPYDGQIGEAAKLGWESHVEETKKELKLMGNIDAEKAAPAVGAGILAFLLLL
jgi:hypothetical protein